MAMGVAAVHRLHHRLPPAASLPQHSSSSPTLAPAFTFPYQSQCHCRAFLSLPSFSSSSSCSTSYVSLRRRSNLAQLVLVGQEGTELQVSPAQEDLKEDYPTPQDLEYVNQIKRVLDLLKKNRDMLFSEVKLTVMIEDPREVERRRLLGIEDTDAPTREDLADVLEQVNEGKVPEDRVALRMLAEEMIQWPNLELEAPKKKGRKSLYAKATDTGVDPKVAAKRLNVDWDTAAEIEEEDVGDETEVPKAVGYGALYLVTAFPIIIDDPSLQSAYYTNFLSRPAMVLPVKEMAGDQSISFPMFSNQILQKEKQILVDPGFQKDVSSPAKGMLQPPILTGPKAGGDKQPHAKHKILSFSVPNSATSSPRFGSSLLKKWNSQTQSRHPLPRRTPEPPSPLAQQLPRSKSCSAGRAYTVDEFDITLCSKARSADGTGIGSSTRSFSIFRMNKDAAPKKMGSCEEKFKCGACLFLPGFGKGKPVRDTRREGTASVIAGGPEMEAVVLSRAISLEKFECGSWSSAAMINDDQDGECASQYFDLPMELIRGSMNNLESPVASAFVFSKKDQRKGVVKRGSGRKLREGSPHHVRFSTSPHRSALSSPSCISPRLRKARDDFNAFLEAQRA